MIVVIGATGAIGSELVKRLMERGVPTRAVSRNPEKLINEVRDLDSSSIEFVSEDISDLNSLHRALTGASQLFLALSNSPEQVEIEKSIVRKATEVGIKHIVKISSPLYQEISPVTVALWHQEIEQTLIESNLQYTILRPYAFMQNLLRLAPTISSQGTFLGCMKEAQCNFIDCRDIADVAVEVLMNKNLAGQIYTLTGEEMFSYAEIAEKISTLLNRPIRYIDMNPDILRQNLIECDRMPSWLASHIVEIQTMSVAIPEKPTDTVHRLLGKKPRTLDAFLYEFWERFLYGQ
ncbi:SDR family NAD(P)-dependent oxidoreductase [Lysinibacillus sp. NPDC092081]|uniref:SDR family NAD(P)-dependent oxidoreductase n=1 Tax=Lysinibacillus sp. NPDC092081 TaxID=3364131 RepID=UPI003813A925